MFEKVLYFNGHEIISHKNHEFLFLNLNYIYYIFLNATHKNCKIDITNLKIKINKKSSENE